MAYKVQMGMKRQCNDKTYPLQNVEMDVNISFSLCISGILQGLPPDAETEMASLPVAPATIVFIENVCKRQQWIETVDEMTTAAIITTQTVKSLVPI